MTISKSFYSALTLGIFMYFPPPLRYIERTKHGERENKITEGGGAKDINNPNGNTE